MPTVNKNKQISGGALFSTDSDHILTTADQIYDELRGCYVNEYDFSGNVKSVNGELPDQNGNINIEDKIRTVNGISPDSNKNVDLTSNTLITKDSKLETLIWNFTIENNSITLDGNGKNLFDSKSSNVFCNGTALNYIYILDNHINFVFENVLYNNNLYNFVIQIYKTGTYSILYKIPVKFYLNIISDDSWEVLDYNGEDITDLFIADMFNQTYPHSINPDRIQSDIIDDIINSVYTIDTLIIFNGFVDRYKVYRISLNTLNKTFTEDYVENLEMLSNKVTQITQENKNSTVLYPSVKALVDYVKDIKPQEETLEASTLSEFLAAAKTISENTSASQRYRLNIKDIIDFSAPTDSDKQAKIKWNNLDVSVYNSDSNTWNFEGIFMYTTIVGISGSATLKTTYINEDKIDTVTLKLYTGNFENIVIGGSAVATDSSGKIHYWNRPLFLGTNNINFKFTNCSFPILGHKTSDNSEHCLLIKTESDTSHKPSLGNYHFKFYHTSIKFINCSWSPGRNKQMYSAGNLANAPILLDFSNNSSSDYYDRDYTRGLEIIANIKTARYSDSGDNAEYDLSEIGIPLFYIKGNRNEIWSVSSDAHALVKSDNNASIRYFATVQIQDAFFKQAAYTKASDPSFNTDYQLVKYIQDLENRIKTLETRLNTN